MNLTAFGEFTRNPAAIWRRRAPEGAALRSSAEPRRSLHSRGPAAPTASGQARSVLTRTALATRSPYGSGRRSGPCAHLRVLGSRRGSSLQLMQTTATVLPKLRQAQLSSAFRTAGTPSGPDGAWPSISPCDGTLVQPTAEAQARR